MQHRCLHYILLRTGRCKPASGHTHRAGCFNRHCGATRPVKEAGERPSDNCGGRPPYDRGEERSCPRADLTWWWRSKAARAELRFRSEFAPRHGLSLPTPRARVINKRQVVRDLLALIFALRRLRIFLVVCLVTRLRLWVAVKLSVDMAIDSQGLQNIKSLSGSANPNCAWPRLESGALGSALRASEVTTHPRARCRVPIR